MKYFVSMMPSYFALFCVLVCEPLLVEAAACDISVVISIFGTLGVLLLTAIIATVVYYLYREKRRCKYR